MIDPVPPAVPADRIQLAILVVLVGFTPLLIDHSFHQPFILPKCLFVGALGLTSFGAWLVGVFVRNRLVLPGGSAFALLFALVGWELATFVRSGSFVLSLRAWALQVAFAWWFTVAALSLRTTRRRTFVMAAALAAAATVAGLSLLQYYELDVTILPHLRVAGLFNLGNLVMCRRAETEVTLYSLLGHRNYVSGYLVAVLPLTLGLVVTAAARLASEGIRRRPLAQLVGSAAVAVLGGMVVVLSHTRGAWIGLAAGLVVFCGLALRLGSRRHATAAVTTVVAFCILALALATWPAANRMRQSAAQRLSSTLHVRRGSVNERWLVLQSAWRVITADPATFLVGRGLGTYVIHHVPAQTTIVREPGGEVFWNVVNKSWYVHNEVLNFWAETGLVGLFLYGGFLVCLGRRLVSALRREEHGPDERMLALAGTAALCAVLTHNLVTFGLHLPSTGTLFFVLAGSLYGWSNRHTDGLRTARLFRTPPRPFVLAIAGAALAAGLTAVPAMRLVETRESEREWGRAYDLQRDGDSTGALVRLANALRWSPRLPDLVFDYGRFLLDTQRPVASRRAFAGIRDVYVDATIHYNIASTYLLEHRYEAAAAEFERALHISPAHEKTLLALARLAIRLQTWQRADELFLRGIQFHRGNARLWFYGGLTALGAGRDDEALRRLAQASKLDPAFVRARALAALVRRVVDDSAGLRTAMAAELATSGDDIVLRTLAARLATTPPAETTGP